MALEPRIESSNACFLIMVVGPPDPSISGVFY